MDPIAIAILLAIILGVVQYFGENICKACGRYYKHAISFSAGVAITYLFLDLFPSFSVEVINTNQFLFIFLLVGFVIFHLVEKYIYQHSKEGVLEKRLGIENQVISFMYHFILGVIIVDFSRQGFQEVILLFIPIVIFTAVGTLPISQHPSNKVNFIVSLSILLGVLFAGFVYPDISVEIQTALLGVVIGGLFFLVIRHSLPMGKEGKPLFFIIGIVIYAPIIILSWLV
jgi:hypothetical protein